MSVETVVNLPIPPEELQRRLMVEVHRLAGLATVDWTFQLQHRAGYFTEHFSKSPAEMKSLVLACLKDAAKAKAEERRIEQRAQRDQEKAKREEERKAEKDAGRKAKQKAKGLHGANSQGRETRRSTSSAADKI